MDDVFPCALALGGDGGARLWVGTADAGIAMQAAPSGGFSARDTALVLDGAFDAGRFVGTLRDGDGRERQVLAQAYRGPRVPAAGPVPPPSRRLVPKEWMARVRALATRPDSAVAAYAFPPDFLAAAGSEKWLRSYATAGGTQRLALSRLPGNQLRGSLYLANVGTTLLAQGTLSAGGLRLRLTRLDGRVIGTLDGRLEGEGRLTAKLALADATQDLRFDLREAFALEARQHGGHLDLVLPGPAVSQALVDFAGEHQRRLAAEGHRGSAWFEPLRVDEDVISGYVHVRTDGESSTRALTLDRRADRLVAARRFVTGPKRDRAAAAGDRLRLAAAAHPLRDDADFRDWLATAELSRVTVLTEGLAYATARHPVYGVVQWVAPWSALEAPLRNRVAHFR